MRPPTSVFSPTLPAWALLATAVALAGCSSPQPGYDIWGRVAPYRIEIVQGNVVTREQIAQVKPGMQKAQVRDVLGSPLLADIFHTDRWDYVFTIRRLGTEPQQRSIVVWFDGDRVRSVDAPELPSEQDFVAAISRNRLPEQPRRLQLTDEERKALPAPQGTPVQAAAVPQGAVRSYPPLESL